MNRRTMESSVSTGSYRFGRILTFTLETLLFMVVVAIEILAFFYRAGGAAWPGLLVFALLLTTPLPWLMGILRSRRAWTQIDTSGTGNPFFGYCRIGSAYLPLLIALLLILSWGR